jgi:hypothetical protein
MNKCLKFQAISEKQTTKHSFLGFILSLPTNQTSNISWRVLLVLFGMQNNCFASIQWVCGLLSVVLNSK